MEEFFKDVFYDYVNAPSPRATEEAYLHLVRTYGSALRRTTNGVARKGARGPIYRLLRAAATRSSALTVVTFNHDLIIENVLGDSKLFARRWCLRHGYGTFGVNRRLTASKNVAAFDDPKECTHDRPVRLLKLHGSLNWYLDADSPEGVKALLRGERAKGQVVRISKRKEIPKQYVHQGHIGGPVVVPPIYAKQRFLDSFMRPVWEDAAADLARADRVVFFGYSMPSTDIEAEKLFQRSLAANSRIRWIDIVNPQSASASRYSSVFPRTPLRRYPSLDSFFSGGSGLPTVKAGK